MTQPKCIAHILYHMFFLTAIFVTAVKGADENRPSEHFCPINMTIMRDPVVASDGHSYERESIQEWLTQSVNGAIRSPVSGHVMDCSIVPNTALRKIIEEWKPTREDIPSKMASKEATEIARKVKEEFDKNKQLLEPEQTAKDKHIVAFLGNTGAGKSTIVNLLAGKRLRTDDDGSYVLEDTNDSSAMAIGTGGSSETLYPKSIDVDIPNIGTLRLFDLPGFNDTDGSERNLVNAAFTRRTLLEASSVRLIFVVGEDQFTADRAASVRDMFHAVKNLFVVNEGGDQFVQQGVFVGTKILGNSSKDVVSFLLKKTKAEDKTDLNEQLAAWRDAQRICLMPHAVMNADLSSVRDSIIAAIASTKAVRINGINVSALYPPQTEKDLFRMFSGVMGVELNRKKQQSYATLSEYEDAIAHWSHPNFWDHFENEVCENEQAFTLLKDFSFNPYERARRTFRHEKAADIQKRISDLKRLREQRIDLIEQATASKALETVLSVGQPKDDERIMFDFAYHKDFYDQVCGPDHISKLSTDPKEQEVVRQYYAGWIADHSHQQMMKWHQRYSGYDDVVKRLAILEGKFLQQEALEKKPQEVEQQQKLLDERRRLEEAQSFQIVSQAQTVPVSKPVGDGIVVPDWITQETGKRVYQMFLSGALIYKNGQPDEIKLPIAALANPLEGVFDLSRCGDAGNYLSIRTGYRKGKITYPNASPSNGTNRVEIWLVPRFLIEREVRTSAQHFGPVMTNWDVSNAPIGIFWSWSADSIGSMYYLTTLLAMDNTENLYDKGRMSTRLTSSTHSDCAEARHRHLMRSSVGHLFHIHFVN